VCVCVCGERLFAEKVRVMTWSHVLVLTVVLLQDCVCVSHVTREWIMSHVNESYHTCMIREDMVSLACVNSDTPKIMRVCESCNT